MSENFSINLKEKMRRKLDALAEFYGIPAGNYLKMKITEDYKNKFELPPEATKNV
jgi:predicted DNA-binding protein